MTQFKKIMMRGVAATALLSFAMSSALTATAAEKIGINAAIKGDVTIRPAEMEARRAVLKDPVFLGNEVNSRRQSALQILLKDESVFTVGADCVLTIDKFVYDPSRGDNSIKSTVKKGMFRFMSGKVSKSGASAVTLDTPTATIGIRGTMLEGLVGAQAADAALQAGLVPQGTAIDRDGASIIVLRGPGKGKSGQDKRGEITVTSGGQSVVLRQSGLVTFVANKDASPTEPIQLTAELYDLFSKYLRTEPGTGAGYRPFTVDTPVAILSAEEIQTDTDFDPYRDFEWPFDLDGVRGFDDACNPLNPNYPACEVEVPFEDDCYDSAGSTPYCDPDVGN